MRFLIKYDGRISEGTPEALWELAEVQNSLIWDDLYSFEDFVARVETLGEAGKRLIIGSVEIWKRKDAHKRAAPVTVRRSF